MSAIEIDSKTNISDAVKILVSNGIISAPVYDSKAKKYLGFFDINDALAVIRGVEVLKGVIPKSKFRNQYLNIHGINLDLSKSENATALDLPVSMILIQGHMTAPWNAVTLETDLKDVLRLLGLPPTLPWSPCRRVPIVDDSGKVFKVLSQSEMVNQIYRAVVREGAVSEPLFVQSFRTHRMGNSHVLSIREDQEVCVAFDMIIAHNVSAIAIVNKDGVLTTSISNKDIGTLLQLREKAGNDEDPIHLSAIEYVKIARASCIANGRTRSEAVTVDQDMLIQDIIATLAEHKTHRVFVVDEKKRPIGVISVSDIVSLMFREELPWPSAVIAKHMSEA